LSKAKTKAQGISCINNLKQLQIAWYMYCGDNNDSLVRNGGVQDEVTDPTDPSAQPGGTKSKWVQGRMDQTVQVATNTALIRVGLLYPYVNNVGVYKCPADNKPVRGFPTCRSMSMNCWMNPLPGESWNDAGGNHPGKVREFRKLSEITAPGPSMAFVFIDENPWGINDGFFVSDPAVVVWIDYPASYHNGAGGLSFADGHAEIRKWRDPVVLGINSPPSWHPGTSGVGDLEWLQQRSSSLNQ
jgi:prepilin-type processing-associated H-X9-DG protein